MSWSASPLSVLKVKAVKDPKTKVLTVTLEGAGYDARSCEIILVHPKTTVVDFVPALKSAREDKPSAGVLRGYPVTVVNPGAVQCTVKTKNAPAGKYRVVVAQVVGNALQVALSKSTVTV